ncbi:MAG: hypothetical protein E6G01_03815 [Actinobacteria bacterium]|nr:MAG: hypothetical protein E6G01_03815 [Actinomycetota bacterium]
MGNTLRDQEEALARVTDPFAQSALRLAYHVRRYALLYVCGALGALALGLFPTVSGGELGGHLAAGGASNQYGNAGQFQAGTSAGAGGLTAAGPGAASAGPAASSVASSAGPTSGAGVGGVQVGTGVTRGGFPCKPGVNQLPFSQYAAPCEAQFTGNNGGATYNGVTPSAITVAIRHTSDANGANAQAANAQIEAAGGQSYDTVRGYTQKIVDYFNKTFEFYGRQIKLVDYNGQGNNTKELLGQDQAGACADADQAATSVHAFGDVNFEINEEPDPFSQCAARYHLYVPHGSAYFPESDFQQLDPYVWNIAMNCQLISQESAEFIGKQLAFTPAKWAGNDGALNMANTQRKFATYVPNNAGYQDCVALAKSIDQNQYHMSQSQSDQYNYSLDISTFPQDAQRAIVQFSSNHDTTVILACDPISPIFLTQDASQQNYHPEWMLNGVALTDEDNWAQLWTPSEVNGHLFGLSQNGSTQIALDPNGEAGQALKAAGVPLNPSSVLDYLQLLTIADQIQAAGPTLNPQNLAAATHRLPVEGGPTGMAGTWHWGSTHTAIIDSREIYWNGSKPSPANNKQGTYLEIYGGKRFQVGQFPSGQPPFYP